MRVKKEPLISPDTRADTLETIVMAVVYVLFAVGWVIVQPETFWPMDFALWLIIGAMYFVFLTPWQMSRELKGRLRKLGLSEDNGLQIVVLNLIFLLAALLMYFGGS